MRSQQKLSSILCHLFLLCLIPTFVQGSCTSSDQCGNPQNPICSSGTCRKCQTHDECVANVPGTVHCDYFGSCTLPCTTASDCTVSNYADCASNGFCTICTQDSHCTSNSNFGIEFKCVNAGSGAVPCGGLCAADTDCMDPLASRCDSTQSYHCNVCTSDTQCSHISLTPHCLDSVSCVECTDNTHCASGTCSDYKCTCSSNSQCTDATLSRCYHDVCQSCTADSDCTHISGKPSCTSGTCQAAVVSASASSSSGDITDGDIIIGAVFGSIVGVGVVIIVVFKILSWQKQRKARLSNPHQKVKTTSINTQSPSDLSPPVHSESAPINQEIDIKPSI